MDLLTLLRQGIAFGPFETDYHRRVVDREFQDAFLRHVAEAVVPNLSIPTDSVAGGVRAKFDRPRYLGPNSAVKYKYLFEGKFQQSGGAWQKVRLEFRVESPAPALKLHFEDPQYLLTSRDVERMRENEAADLREQAREGVRLLPSGGSLEAHWEACVPEWTRFDTVGDGSDRWARIPPLTYHLCERFASLHPEGGAFLLERVTSAEPRLAFYAFQTWIRLAGSSRERFPAEGLARQEEIRVHSGCFVYHQKLLELFADHWKEPRAGS